MFPSHPNIPGEVEIDNKTTLVDTWKAMIALPKHKVGASLKFALKRHSHNVQVKAIGVSNFTVEHLKAIIEETGVVPVSSLQEISNITLMLTVVQVANQVEAHPLLPQDDLVEFCKEHNIHITAYSPLGNNLVGKPQLTEHAVVKEVADKLNATPAQILVAWGAHRGYSVIPKSVQEHRIISNFKQVELSQEDYEKITSIGVNNRTRFNIPRATNTPRWDINLFNEPEEQDAAFVVNVS